MKYYKITNEEENHRGLQYKTGLVEDILPFYPEGLCEPGGIYFAREGILAFIHTGPWIREVTLPEDAQVYEESYEPDEHTAWKADKVILGERRRLTVEVIRELIEEGADVHARTDWALCWATQKGYLEVVKLLIEHGADVHAASGFALRWAAEGGHVEVVELLIEHGADVHAVDDLALRWAAEGGHVEVVELLIEHGADVHAENGLALHTAEGYGHTEVAKILKEAMGGEQNPTLYYVDDLGNTHTLKDMKNLMCCGNCAYLQPKDQEITMNTCVSRRANGNNIIKRSTPACEYWALVQEDEEV